MARRVWLAVVFVLLASAATGAGSRLLAASSWTGIRLAGSSLENPASGCFLDDNGQLRCEDSPLPPSTDEGAAPPDGGIAGESPGGDDGQPLFPGAPAPDDALVEPLPEVAVPVPAPDVLEVVPGLSAAPQDAIEIVEVGRPVRASRLFAGPGEYPPTDFAAYGVVAFPERATGETKARHMMVCDAYVASLPKPGDLAVPPSQQMVTIWPIASTAFADKARSASDSDACGMAVDNYNLPAGQGALLDARAATDERLDGQGPYLVAWSPPTDKGKSRVVALVFDLSGATTEDQIREYFRRWRGDIEADPALWKGGWSVETVRLKIRDWLDSVGAQLAVFIKKGEG